ncbi:MAG: recombination factor protein RarA, partial [Actinobacteria bacterium]|nr:recombination factor protein RarA [Actinomycetota bacterium]
MRPLLSRAPVYVLEPLGPDDLRSILDDALSSGERGLGSRAPDAADEALDFIAHAADGDARR